MRLARERQRLDAYRSAARFPVPAGERSSETTQGVCEMEKKETTRVYQYGAVPIDSKTGRARFVDPFPQAGVDELRRRNDLWNKLVEIDKDSRNKYKNARRAADAGYREVDEKIDAVELQIREAYVRKRDARKKAKTRDAGHPLIKRANREISKLKDRRGELWAEIKPHRKEADKRIDKKALNGDFNERVQTAQRVKNTGCLNGPTANETARYFKEARGRTFDNPKSRLRFHRFDGTGFIFYRFKRPGEGETKYGVTFEEILRGEIKASESFRLAPAALRGGSPVVRLRAKVAGGARKASKVYAEFHLHLHRPIPEGAQINNAKLLRRRVGDRFRYTVNFSVRVPAVTPPEDPSARALGVDIGFKKMRDQELRVATIAAESASGWEFQHVTLPPELVARMKRVEKIQGDLDDSAAGLGRFIQPRLKAFVASLDEKHLVNGLVRKIVKLPANVTLNFEMAYKLGGDIRRNRGNLPAEVEEETLRWRECSRKLYGEMHGLRRKTLGWRREIYRIAASRMVTLGLPIGMEDIDLRQFAEVRDVDNELPDKARSQRFDVALSEFLGAIKNCAEREGVAVVKINPAYTSKTCSGCGVPNDELGSEVHWTCPECGAAHDRDENAAKNIARAAREKRGGERRKKKGG